jgi:hypothetical protein
MSGGHRHKDLVGHQYEMLAVLSFHRKVVGGL